MHAQQRTFTAAVPIVGLPAAALSVRIPWFITDGISSSDCTVGHGTYVVTCVSNGTIWAATNTGPTGPAGPTGMTGMTGMTGPAGTGGGFTVAQSVQWVAPDGNDSNSGLSATTAKLTWSKACEALTGGSSVAPLTCGGGTIYVIGTVFSQPDHNYGRMLMGSGDPNYAAPPTGWHRLGVSIQTICAAATFDGGIGVAIPKCIVAGGTQTNPALWLAGIDQGWMDKSIGWGDYAKGAVIGPNSNGERGAEAGSGAQNIVLDHVYHNHGDGWLGCGPGIDIGSNVFWLYIRDPQLQGCLGETWVTTPTGLSRTSNVVTAITAATAGHSATNDYIVGEWITVTNATDTSFNGSFHVTAVSGSPQTVIQWAQQAPNVSNKYGELLNYHGASIAVRPGATGYGSGLIFIDHPGFSSGGVWNDIGLNGGGIYIDNVTMEGTSVAPGLPPLLSVRPPTAGHVYDVEGVADSDFSRTKGVEIDNGCAVVFYVMRVDQVEGCFSVAGTDVTSYQKSPLAKGQFGIFQSNANPVARLFAQTDAAARQFGPVSVRYPNIATNFAASSWVYSSATGTITTGLASPDGRAAAGNVTSASGDAFVQFYHAGAVTLTVGDRYAYSIWARSASAALPSMGVKFNLNGDGYGAGDTCAPSFGQSQGGVDIAQTGPYTGDGEWFRFWGLCTIYQAPNTAGLYFQGHVSTTQSSDFYAPTIIKIPAGEVSDNEALEIASNLGSYSPTCIVGQFCSPAGPTPELTRNQSWTGNQNLSGSTMFTVPVVSSFVATAEGNFGFDTGPGKMYHGFVNGVDAISLFKPVATTVNNGDVVTYAVAGTNISVGKVTAASLSGISGLTTGCIPKAATATTITTCSALDDSVTTASTVTSTLAFVAPSITTNAAGAGSIRPTLGTVAALPAAAAGNKGWIQSVSDSTAIGAEGQNCAGGGAVTALAFSNGTVWKCF